MGRISRQRAGQKEFFYNSLSVSWASGQSSVSMFYSLTQATIQILNNASGMKKKVCFTLYTKVTDSDFSYAISKKY